MTEPDQYQDRLDKAESVLIENEIDIRVNRDTKIVQAWARAHPWEVKFERFMECWYYIRRLFRTRSRTLKRHAKIREVFEAVDLTPYGRDTGENDGLDMLRAITYAVPGVTTEEIVAALVEWDR